MIQLVSAVAVTLLTVFLGPLLRGEVEGRLVRRARAVAELREKVEPGSPAQRHLDALLNDQAAMIRVRGRARIHRKVNGSNLSALIFVGVVGGGVVYGLLTLAFQIHDPIAFWIVIVLTVIVGVFIVGLTAAGSRTIFAPKKPTGSASST